METLNQVIDVLWSRETIIYLIGIITIPSLIALWGIGVYFKMSKEERKMLWKDESYNDIEYRQDEI